MKRINYVFLSLLEDKQESKFGVMMTGYLMLFLACILVNFSMFLQEKERVLEQLPMILGLL